MNALRICAASVAALLSCGPRPAEEPIAAAMTMTSIVTAERRGDGSVLVFIDSAGRRINNLTEYDEGVFDRQPTWSPDGKWIVYASNRGRPNAEESSLWAIAAVPGSIPVRLTDTARVDRDPAWTPDGLSVVFSSSRGDTQGLAIHEVRVVPQGPHLKTQGDPTPLTRDDELAMAPSVSPDGSEVVFMSMDVDANTTLWRVDRDSRRRTRLTDGPHDSAPAWLPNGRGIVFSAPAAGRDDIDIFRVPLSGMGRKPWISEPVGDQAGVRFSKDGSHVFATSVLRTSAGSPVLSSVVVAKLTDSPVWRALHDDSYVESRVGVAVSPDGFSATSFAGNPSYCKTMVHLLEQYGARKIRGGANPHHEGEAPKADIDRCRQPSDAPPRKRSTGGEDGNGGH